MADLTQDEIFLAQGDIKFTAIDPNSALKSNEMINGKNWKALEAYLTKLKASVRYVRSLIDIEALTKAIIENFQNNKTVVLVDYTMLAGSSMVQTINGITFRISRISEYTVEITNVNNATWNVNNLNVQVKSNEGQIVYPVIITIDSKISVYFNDGIKTNYNVIIL